jgi:hypothetical protein
VQKKSVLIPSLFQLVFYVVLGLLLLVITNYQTILKVLGGESLEKIGGANYLVEGRDYYLDNIFGLPILGNTAVILFWAGIGCGIYCLVWFFSNSAKEAKKYNEAAGYVKPKGYSATQFWESNASHMFLLVASIAMLLLLFSVFMGGYIPASESLLFSILTDFGSSTSMYAITILLASWIVFGYLFYALLHVFNYARKVVFF